MKKSDMLPVFAALVIALLVVPIAALPAAFAQVPTDDNFASVVTIPEDDASMNMGLMVLGLTQPTLTLLATDNWFTDKFCTTRVSVIAPPVVGPELNSAEPIIDPVALTTLSTVVYYQHLAEGAACVAHNFTPLWPGARYGPGWDFLSQHKILATLNGVPTKPDYTLCEIVEKEKAKIPPQTEKSPSKRQFPDEIVKTTLIDVTSNFICKFRWIKPGVGALDVYFVGPHVYDFIADHMLVVTVGYKVGKTTIWATDLQDICILGWSMDPITLAVGLFINPGLSAAPTYAEVYYSWPHALGLFSSCDEAAAWQRAYYLGGWMWSEN